MARAKRAAADPEVQSEGQRLLLEQPGSHAEVAAAVGCSKQMVSYWRRGEKRPGRASRTKIAAVFGIDPSAWERAPGASPAPAPPAPEAPAPRHRPAPVGKPSTLDEVEQQLSMLRELQRDDALLASERVRLADSVGKLLAIKARLERDQELLEDRVVRQHPFWARVKAAVLGALRPHPDAARDVAEALSEAEGS